MNENINPIRLGGLYDTPEQSHQAGSIWNANGISPSLDTCSGGNRMPIVLEAQSFEEAHGYLEENYISNDGVSQCLRSEHIQKVIIYYEDKDRQRRSMDKPSY